MYSILLLSACLSPKHGYPAKTKPRANKPARLTNGFNINEQNQTTYYQSMLDCMATPADSSITSLVPVDSIKRKVTYRNFQEIPLKMEMQGTHSFEICVNREGFVGIIKLISSPATPKNIKIMMQAAIRYEFEKSEISPCIECGKLTLALDFSSISPKK